MGMINPDPIKIGAVVLAAGLSKRMGKPKMLLPWHASTVIEQVVLTLINAEVSPIVVVTGGARADVEKAIQKYAVLPVFNPQYQNGEMLNSLQIGLENLGPEVEAALIVLGDQPKIEERVVRKIRDIYLTDKPEIIVPSFQMRRGHPWIVARSLWPQIIALSLPQNLRDFLAHHQQQIRYVDVDTASILMDLDTPEDYIKQSQASDT
jgi:molybdenum cofactor cytidylyltransferase